MSESTWGVKFNQSPTYERLKKDQKPQGCPDWLTQYQFSEWQGEGLIVWNNDEKRIAQLRCGETLSLLKVLQTKEEWKKDGVSITRHAIKIEFELPRRGRRKKTEPESASKESKSENVLEEIVHLPPDAGPRLIELIQANEKIISEMAKQEKERFQKGIMDLLEHAEEWHHEKEQKDFDFSTCTFKWELRRKNRWVCQHQQAQGHVCLDSTMSIRRASWHACVERPGFARKSEYVPQFSDAIAWTENELADLANQSEPPEPRTVALRIAHIEANRVWLRQKYLDGPFWIRPAAMEPERITYHVFIELEAEPISYKTYESICGDNFRIDQHYLIPSKQAATIGLDFDKFRIDQPLGEDSEWYQFTSLTAYYQQAPASEQALGTWDHSKILQQFKAGKIIRGRYGYKEGGTGFVVFLGACESADNPWERTESREKYLEDRALRATLCYALDVNDFRDYLGLTLDETNDERLIETMHHDRAKSICMPAEVRLDSKLWLAQYETIS
jgi:hypothetical protein